MSFKGTWVDTFADWVQEPGARDKGLKTAQYVIKLALLQAGACKDVSRGEFAMKSPLHAIAAATGSPATAGTMAVAIRSQEGWMKAMASAISMSRKVVLLGDSVGDFVDTVEAAKEFVASPSTSAGLALLRAAGDLACDACTEAATIAKMTGRKSVRLRFYSSLQCGALHVRLHFRIARPPHSSPLRIAPLCSLAGPARLGGPGQLRGMVRWTGL